MARGNKRKNGLLAFTFLLPLVFIVIYLAVTSSQSISIDNVQQITVVSPETEAVSITTAEDIEFFKTALKSAQHTNSAIRDIEGETPVAIICHQDGKTAEYKLYPSLNASGCILVSPEKEMYLLDTNHAKQLLLRDEFAYLYSSYFLPKMIVTSGGTETEIPPVSSTWSYYKTDDVLYDYVPTVYGSGEEIYTIVKGLENSIKFTPGNDILPYTVTESSIVAQQGDTINVGIDNIADIDRSADSVLNVTVKVEWSNKNNAIAFGNAEYRFKLAYDIPATLEADIKSEYTAGEIIKIYANNLNNGEDVNISTMLEIPRIEFDKIDDNKSVAFLPIGFNKLTSDEVKNYSLTVNSIADSITAEIDIKAPDSGIWMPISATTEEYTASLSPEKIAEFRKAMEELTITRPAIAEPYFIYKEGESILEAPISGNPKFGFGKKVNIGVPGSEGGAGAHTCEGLIYEVEEGTAVRAAQKGEIVFSGELATTGKTIVIYHGYGIYTYYFHLDSYDDVRAGTIVNDGRVLGTAGKTGFTGGKTVLNFAVSIDGVFVDPQYFLTAE